MLATHYITTPKAEAKAKAQVVKTEELAPAKAPKTLITRIRHQLIGWATLVLVVSTVVHLIK